MFSGSPKDPKDPIAASSPILTRSIPDGHVLIPTPNLWLSERLLMDLARDPKTCWLYLAETRWGSDTSFLEDVIKQIYR